MPTTRTSCPDRLAALYRIFVKHNDAVPARLGKRRKTFQIMAEMRQYAYGGRGRD